MKYVVDTCIFNKLVHGVIEPDQLPRDGEFIATHVQVDELNKTKDEERRARLFLKFATIAPDIVPTETVVAGVSRFGHGKLSDGITYDALKKGLDMLNGGKANNSRDALIAEVAIKNGYTPQG